MAEPEADDGSAAVSAPALPAPASLQNDDDIRDVGLSPHHRAFLYFGMLLLAWWLIAAASGPNAYSLFRMVHGQPDRAAGAVRLHLGADPSHARRHRHFIWDTGRGFEPAERELLAIATIVGSISFTLGVWVVGYLAMGGPR